MAFPPQTFTLRSMPERGRQLGDLWADIYAHGHSLNEPSEKLRALLSDTELHAALAAGRRKRPTKQE
jgi:DNA primase